MPIAVKEQVAVKNYVTTAGTTFLNTAPAARDEVSVARLREAGALLYVCRCSMSVFLSVCLRA